MNNEMHIGTSNYCFVFRNGSLSCASGSVPPCVCRGLCTVTAISPPTFESMLFPVNLR